MDTIELDTDDTLIEYLNEHPEVFLPINAAPAVRECMRRFARKALVLASERATLKGIQQHYEAGGYIEVIDKQSILDVNELIK